jgi:hypothetical protein
MSSDSFDPKARPRSFKPQRSRMFDGLVDPAFTSLEDATVPEVLNAQAASLSWLDELGAPADVLPDGSAKELARSAFTAVTDANTDPAQAKAAILAARAPAAVRHLAGMLTEYDWAFVEQASEIRSYIAAKLLEHSQSADARISLAALKQLGAITEVGAFTERVEVTHKTQDTSEITERLREKLQRLKAGAIDVPTKTIAS